MPATINRSMRLGVEGGQAVVAELKRIGDQGEQSFARVATGSQNASRALAQAAAAANQNERSFARIGTTVQQAGFQIGDFAVQVASGQSPLTAFIQQGSQIAGAFGPWGAVIGAAGAVVGALVTGLGSYNTTGGESKSLTDAMSAAHDAFAGSLAASASNAEDLTRKIAALTDAERELERLRIGVAQRSNQDALDTNRRRVEIALANAEEASGRDRLEAIRRQREIAGQLGADLTPPPELAAAQAQLEEFFKAADQFRQGGSALEVARFFDSFVTKTPGAEEALRQLRDDLVGAATDTADLEKKSQRLSAALDAVNKMASKGELEAAFGAPPPERTRRTGGAGRSEAQRESEEVIRNAQRDADAIAQLQRQLLGYADARAAAIENATSRLSDTASPEAVARTKELAAAIYDAGEARRLDAERQREQSQLMREGEQVTRQYGDATALLAEHHAHLNELAAAGAIDQRTLARAMAQTTAEAERMLAAQSNDPFLGLRVGLREYVDDAGSLAETVAGATTASLDALSAEFAQFVLTGKMSFEDLARSAIESLTEIAIKAIAVQAITGIVGLAFGGTGTATTAGVNAMFATAHTGGIVGDLHTYRNVDPRVFIGAPRFHAGGLVGDEVPIIARRGEMVLTPEQQQQRQHRPPAKITVNATINGLPAEGQGQIRYGPGEDATLDILIEQKMNRIAQRGGLDRTMQNRYGARPKVG